MLTSDLAQSWQRGVRTGPRLLDAADATLLRVASELIDIVREHDGRTRGELQAALDLYVGTGTDYRILRGLIKLLTDLCEFETVSPIEPEEIRRRLFLHARTSHPIVTRRSPADDTGQGSARAVAVETVARELNCAASDIDAGLYADLSAEQRLTAFDEPDAADLLARYNLAQAQALLYRAIEMRVGVAPREPAHARLLFDAIKAYGLIHSIEGDAEAGYEVTLTGPVSMFHRAQKYGVQMAVFLPALLLCEGWHMRAEIAPKSREGDARAGRKDNLIYELDAGQRDLRTHLLPPAKHSGDLPSRLLAAWKRSKSVGEESWTLERTVEVIDLGASAFVPDLVARRADGKKVYVEFLGFWTPTHLARRAEEFARERFEDWLLIVSDDLRCSREPPLRIPGNVLTCKSAPTASLVRAKLDEIVGGSPAP